MLWVTVSCSTGRSMKAGKEQVLNFKILLYNSFAGWQNQTRILEDNCRDTTEIQDNAALWLSLILGMVHGLFIFSVLWDVKCEFCKI